MLSFKYGKSGCEPLLYSPFRSSITILVRNFSILYVRSYHLPAPRNERLSKSVVCQIYLFQYRFSPVAQMFFLRMQVLVVSLLPWQCRQAILLIHGLWLLCLICRFLLGTTPICFFRQSETLWQVRLEISGEQNKNVVLMITNYRAVVQVHCFQPLDRCSSEIVYLRQFKHNCRCFHHIQPHSAASCHSHYQWSGCATSFSCPEADFDKGVSWRHGALNFQLKRLHHFISQSWYMIVVVSKQEE